MSDLNLKTSLENLSKHSEVIKADDVKQLNDFIQTKEVNEDLLAQELSGLSDEVKASIAQSKNIKDILYLLYHRKDAEQKDALSPKDKEDIKHLAEYLKLQPEQEAGEQTDLDEETEAPSDFLQKEGRIIQEQVKNAVENSYDQKVDEVTTRKAKEVVANPKNQEPLKRTLTQNMDNLPALNMNSFKFYRTRVNGQYQSLSQEKIQELQSLLWGIEGGSELIALLNAGEVQAFQEKIGMEAGKRGKNNADGKFGIWTYNKLEEYANEHQKQNGGAENQKKETVTQVGVDAYQESHLNQNSTQASNDEVEFTDETPKEITDTTPTASSEGQQQNGGARDQEQKTVTTVGEPLDNNKSNTGISEASRDEVEFTDTTPTASSEGQQQNGGARDQEQKTVTTVGEPLDNNKSNTGISEASRDEVEFTDTTPTASSERQQPNGGAENQKKETVTQEFETEESENPEDATSPDQEIRVDMDNLENNNFADELIQVLPVDRMQKKYEKQALLELLAGVSQVNEVKAFIRHAGWQDTISIIEYAMDKHPDWEYGRGNKITTDMITQDPEFTKLYGRYFLRGKTKKREDIANFLNLISKDKLQRIHAIKGGNKLIDYKEIANIQRWAESKGIQSTIKQNPFLALSDVSYNGNLDKGGEGIATTHRRSEKALYDTFLGQADRTEDGKESKIIDGPRTADLIQQFDRIIRMSGYHGVHLDEYFGSKQGEKAFTLANLSQLCSEHPEVILLYHRVLDKMSYNPSIDLTHLISHEKNNSLMKSEHLQAVKEYNSLSDESAVWFKEKMEKLEGKEKEWFKGLSAESKLSLAQKFISYVDKVPNILLNQIGLSTSDGEAITKEQVLNSFQGEFHFLMDDADMGPRIQFPLLSFQPGNGVSANFPSSFTSFQVGVTVPLISLTGNWDIGNGRIETGKLDKVQAVNKVYSRGGLNFDCKFFDSERAVQKPEIALALEAAVGWKADFKEGIEYKSTQLGQRFGELFENVNFDSPEAFANSATAQLEALKNKGNPRKKLTENNEGFFEDVITSAKNMLTAMNICEDIKNLQGDEKMKALKNARSILDTLLKGILMEQKNENLQKLNGKTKLTRFGVRGSVGIGLNSSDQTEEGSGGLPNFIPSWLRRNVGLEASISQFKLLYGPDVEKYKYMDEMLKSGENMDALQGPVTSPAELQKQIQDMLHPLNMNDIKVNVNAKNQIEITTTHGDKDLAKRLNIYVNPEEAPDVTYDGKKLTIGSVKTLSSTVRRYFDDKAGYLFIGGRGATICNQRIKEPTTNTILEKGYDFSKFTPEYMKEQLQNSFPSQLSSAEKEYILSQIQVQGKEYYLNGEKISGALEIQRTIGGNPKLSINLDHIPYSKNSIFDITLLGGYIEGAKTVENQARFRTLNTKQKILDNLSDMSHEKNFKWFLTADDEIVDNQRGGGLFIHYLQEGNIDQAVRTLQLMLDSCGKRYRWEKDAFQKLNTYIGELKGDKNRQEELLQILNMIKVLQATVEENQKYGNNLKAMVHKRGEVYKSLLGPAQEKYPLQIDYRTKIVEELSNKQEMTSHTSTNIFGFTAFYHKNNEQGREYALTLPGQTNILGEQQHIQVVAESEQQNAQNWIKNNLNKMQLQNALILNAIKTLLPPDLSEKVRNDDLQNLLWNEKGVVIGDKIVRIKKKAVFYLLAECANESLGLHIQGVEIYEQDTKKADPISMAFTIEDGESPVECSTSANALSISQSLEQKDLNTKVAVISGEVKKEKETEPPTNPPETEPPQKPDNDDGETDQDGNTEEDKKKQEEDKKKQEEDKKKQEEDKKKQEEAKKKQEEAKKKAEAEEQAKKEAEAKAKAEEEAKKKAEAERNKTEQEKKNKEQSDSEKHKNTGGTENVDTPATGR